MNQIIAILTAILSGTFSFTVTTEPAKNTQYQDTMKITYHPIGVFHSPLTPETGAPRQGILQPENRATIELFSPYREALSGLEASGYVIVLYHLHRSRDWHPTVTPPGSGREFGLFATRSPNRPNPIGFSVIKLESVDGLLLHVSGIDAFDGTPVLDIKPWLPSIDCPEKDYDSAIEKGVGISD